MSIDSIKHTITLEDFLVLSDSEDDNYSHPNKKRTDFINSGDKNKTLVSHTSILHRRSKKFTYSDLHILFAM